MRRSERGGRSWGLRLPAKDAPGTGLGLVTPVPRLQKHTYRCHGEWHINKYKYVQIVYLKMTKRQNHTQKKTHNQPTMKTNQCTLGKQTQILETRLHSHRQ